MHTLPTLLHRSLMIPTFLYGTAWKEDHTAALTQLALESGFRGIDTANQRKHYHEVAVGQALQVVYQNGLVIREELFLQSKFTYVNGQDHRLPYDPQADLTTQVKQSFASSLEHLHTDYLDSYILHGPSTGQTWAIADQEVWQAMESLCQSGQVKLLGVSNIQANQLQILLDRAAVKPAFVQNRCYAHTQWDVAVREICRAHDIKYQGFSLLTANVRELNQPIVHQIAHRLEATIPQVLFAFALQVGMMPLTGTSNPQHMREDLQAGQMQLTEEEMNILERIGA